MLTDERIAEVWRKMKRTEGYFDFARAIEKEARKDERERCIKQFHSEPYSLQILTANDCDAAIRAMKVPT